MYCTKTNSDMKKAAGTAVVEGLAQEGRRVLSDWRALILLRRATLMLVPDERRWARAPATPEDIHPLLSRMVMRGELHPLADAYHLYAVTVPYARTGHIEEDEVLMEVHPYAALSHLSALVFHSLTDEVPTGVFALLPADGTGGTLPPGTDGTDWSELQLIRGRAVSSILGSPVQWQRTIPERFFGMYEYRPRGYPVRVTTPERTLLDGLQQPDLCGGFDNVLRAWVLAQDVLDLDRLIGYVERFQIAVLRQRVGFILDELHLTHPAVEAWTARTARGGSSKLLGSAPYAPSFSERWNLSINAPIAVLRDHIA